MTEIVEECLEKAKHDLESAEELIEKLISKI